MRSPDGKCLCGCGQITRVSPTNQTLLGLRKGDHSGYIRGHNGRPSAPYIIDPKTSCWLWQGCRDLAGYGRLKRNGKQISAHRYYYERLRGPIPEGLQLDHICRVRHCINPDHLEPVTLRENMRRGLEARGWHGYTGVSFRPNNARKWVAQIWHDGKHHWIGAYRTVEEAARAYDQRAVELRGAFARTNFREGE